MLYLLHLLLPSWAELSEKNEGFFSFRMYLNRSWHICLPNNLHKLKNSKSFFFFRQIENHFLAGHRINFEHPFCQPWPPAQLGSMWCRSGGGVILGAGVELYVHRTGRRWKSPKAARVTGKVGGSEKSLRWQHCVPPMISATAARHRVAWAAIG